MRRTLKVVWGLVVALTLLSSAFLFHLFYDRHLLIEFDANGRGTDTFGFPVHDTTVFYGVFGVLFALPGIATLLVMGWRRWRRARRPNY